MSTLTIQQRARVNLLALPAPTQSKRLPSPVTIYSAGMPLSLSPWKIVKMHGGFNQSGESRIETDDDTIAHEFAALLNQWEEETMMLSSPSAIFGHPTFQAIIAMGKEGIPFVLRELRDRPNDWFNALALMARENVAQGITDAHEARSRWLEWGYSKGYL